MNRATMGIVIMVILFGVSPHHAMSADCPCDGDVNNDGSVNVIDAVCILDCRAGDCLCCLSSCDINCDGVVDSMDAGDDLATSSTWSCLFTGDDPGITSQWRTGSNC